MGAGIDVHGVGSDLFQRNQIVKHRCVQSEDVPVIAAHSITAFATAKCGKVKWAMDKRVGVGEVDILVKWK
jgi:hypothetical protein